MMLMTMITKQFSKQFILIDEKRRTYNITKDTFAKRVFSTSVGKKKTCKTNSLQDLWFRRGACVPNYFLVGCTAKRKIK